MATDDIISRVFPQFFPAHWLKNPGIVFSDFPSRIRIGYVLREEGQYSYILDDAFAALSITVEELHATALANLLKLPASMSTAKVANGAEGWIAATDDNFAAVRILLPEVQEYFCEVLGEKFLVTLPLRDDCFCWSLTQLEERQEKHAQEALDHFIEDDYNLTPDILVFSHGVFQLHREQIATEPARPPDGDDLQ